MAKIKPVRIVQTKYYTYSLHFKNPDGRRRRLSVGKDYQYAQRLAVRFSDWLLEGKDTESEIEQAQKTESAKAVTVRIFFPKFMERHGLLQSIKMQQLYYTCYNNICRCSGLADVSIGSITKSLMLDYMHLRIKNDGVTAATVNREASFVKGMLSRATEWDILEQNPLNGLHLFREAEKRDVRITTEQVRVLLNELPPQVANLVEFAIYSGFRRENILGLKIETILFYDLTPTAEVELVIKGGKTKIFPLCKQAVKVLKHVINSRTKGYVFINPHTETRYTTIHKSFDRAVRKLGLTVNGTKLRFHDARHIHATWLHKAGASLDQIRPILGHSNRSTTDRYTTIDMSEVSKVLELMPEIRKQAQGSV